MDWLAFWGSIIGGLIGGLFTFLGVRYTIKNENKKARKEELKEADSKKPRFEIIGFKDFKENVNNQTLSNDCNVLALPIEIIKVLNGNVQITYGCATIMFYRIRIKEYRLYRNRRVLYYE